MNGRHTTRAAALAIVVAMLAGGCGPSQPSAPSADSAAHPGKNAGTDAGTSAAAPRTGDSSDAASAGHAALGVRLVAPDVRDWEAREEASGAIAAYDEIELTAPGELPLAVVDARVGDRVRKGQVLARFDTAGLAVKRADADAAVAEANARLAQASAQLDGARTLDETGSISRQELIKAQTQQKVSVAQLAGARARLAGVELQLRRAVVRAPDDGVIAASKAIEGAVPAAGATLFTLIRGGRLEWRAQLGASALAAVRPGQPVELARADGGTARGVVRQVAPVLDKATLAGIVYVDLPADAGLQAGGFASGAIVTGRTRALTLPDAAVVARDGFHYAWTVDARQRVHPVKLVRGRAQDGRVEVLAGLRPDARVVASGAGLLDEGDAVTIVAGGDAGQHGEHGEPAAAKRPAPASASASAPVRVAGNEGAR
ncbi:efflux RND transporter periplasmic adaptor subunit [Burkholderia sp. BCC0397]|uniref:efflux RND transporter periplasmic adaptor subunit n=1 Tax=Burkholderia sp. BCC0397 TaxID=486876 RepID=UPI00158ECC8E|nr:efflux RND transporter periplasmic adaptor subunit [Burkholderia sp. BCC0397]